MIRFLRSYASLLLALAAVGTTPASLGDEPENLRQLQAMPRERRIALSENLERFDKLDAAERAAIRKLDAEIARKDPVEQARYRALLRRYHLWVNGLSEEQKAQLKEATGTEARVNLARKFRLKEMENGPHGPNVYGIRIGDFGMPGPHELAHLLRIWKRLTPGERIEIERKQPRKRLIEAIEAQQKTKGVPHESFSEAAAKPYIARLAGDPAFKRDWGQPKAKAAPRLDELRLAEFLHFESNKLKAVTQPNLERFSASCPNWLHEMLDPLSPDDARAYLTILYRLLYPEPGEMPVETKPAKGQPSPKPSSEKKSGPAGPF